MKLLLVPNNFTLDKLEELFLFVPTEYLNQCSMREEFVCYDFEILELDTCATVF